MSTDPEVTSRLERIEALLEQVRAELARPRLEREHFEAAARAARGEAEAETARAEAEAELRLTRLRCRVPRLWGPSDPPQKA